MKTYEVTLEATASATVYVEAADEEHARTLAEESEEICYDEIGAWEVARVLPMEALS